MENVKHLYETTNLTLQQIADQCGRSMWQVHTYAKRNYTVEHRKNRKVLNYSKSKLGDLNPMAGKTAEQHPNYIGDVSDGKGYLMRLKPEWYTGRKGCKHVFVHHLVICESMGMTEIPKGFCVHHIDEDPLNNDLNNLAYMTTSAHSKLHMLERATTRAKARRV